MGISLPIFMFSYLSAICFQSIVIMAFYSKIINCIHPHKNYVCGLEYILHAISYLNRIDVTLQGGEHTLSMTTFFTLHMHTHWHSGDDCVGATFKWRFEDFSCQMSTSVSFFFFFFPLVTTFQLLKLIWICTVCMHLILTW